MTCQQIYDKIVHPNFSKLKRTAYWTEEEILTIHNILNDCQYGAYALLENDNISMIYDVPRELFCILDFYNPEKPNRGLCNHLCYYTILHLRRSIPYANFIMVDGKDPYIFKSKESIHYFILGYKSNITRDDMRYSALIIDPTFRRIEPAIISQYKVENYHPITFQPSSSYCVETKKLKDKCIIPLYYSDIDSIFMYLGVEFDESPSDVSLYLVFSQFNKSKEQRFKLSIYNALKLRKMFKDKMLRKFITHFKNTKLIVRLN